MEKDKPASKKRGDQPPSLPEPINRPIRDIAAALLSTTPKSADPAKRECNSG